MPEETPVVPLLPGNVQQSLEVKFTAPATQSSASKLSCGASADGQGLQGVWCDPAESSAGRCIYWHVTDDNSSVVLQEVFLNDQISSMPFSLRVGLEDSVPVHGCYVIDYQGQMFVILLCWAGVFSAVLGSSHRSLCDQFDTSRGADAGALSNLQSVRLFEFSSNHEVCFFSVAQATTTTPICVVDTGSAVYVFSAIQEEKPIQLNTSGLVNAVLGYLSSAPASVPIVCVRALPKALPDGSLGLLALSLDSTIRVWSVNTGKCVSELSLGGSGALPGGQGWRFQCCCSARRENSALIGFSDGSISLVVSLTVSQNQIEVISSSPEVDGRILSLHQAVACSLDFGSRDCSILAGIETFVGHVPTQTIRQFDSCCWSVAGDVTGLMSPFISSTSPENTSGDFSAACLSSLLHRPWWCFSLHTIRSSVSGLLSQTAHGHSSDEVISLAIENLKKNAEVEFDQAVARSSSPDTLSLNHFLNSHWRSLLKSLSACWMHEAASGLMFHQISNDGNVYAFRKGFVSEVSLQTSQCVWPEGLLPFQIPSATTEFGAHPSRINVENMPQLLQATEELLQPDSRFVEGVLSSPEQHAASSKSESVLFWRLSQRSSLMIQAANSWNQISGENAQVVPSIIQQLPAVGEWDQVLLQSAIAEAGQNLPLDYCQCVADALLAQLSEITDALQLLKYPASMPHTDPSSASFALSALSFSLAGARRCAENQRLTWLAVQQLATLARRHVAQNDEVLAILFQCSVHLKDDSERIIELALAACACSDSSKRMDTMKQMVLILLRFERGETAVKMLKACAAYLSLQQNEYNLLLMKAFCGAGHVDAAFNTLHSLPQNVQFEHIDEFLACCLRAKKLYQLSSLPLGHLAPYILRQLKSKSSQNSAMPCERLQFTHALFAFLVSRGDYKGAALAMVDAFISTSPCDLQLLGAAIDSLSNAKPPNNILVIKQGTLPVELATVQDLKLWKLACIRLPEYSVNPVFTKRWEAASIMWHNAIESGRIENALEVVHVAWPLPAEERSRLQMLEPKAAIKTVTAAIARRQGRIHSSNDSQADGFAYLRQVLECCHRWSQGFSYGREPQGLRTIIASDLYVSACQGLLAEREIPPAWLLEGALSKSSTGCSGGSAGALVLEMAKVNALFAAGVLIQWISSCHAKLGYQSQNWQSTTSPQEVRKLERGMEAVCSCFQLGGVACIPIVPLEPLEVLLTNLAHIDSDNARHKASQLRNAMQSLGETLACIHLAFHEWTSFCSSNEKEGSATSSSEVLYSRFDQHLRGSSFEAVDSVLVKRFVDTVCLKHFENLA